MAKIDKRNRRSRESKKSAARQRPSPVSLVNLAIAESPDDRFSPVTIPPNLTESRRRDPNLSPIGSRVFPDGSWLELTREAEVGTERLLHWTNVESSTGRVFDLFGSRYAPSAGAGLIRHLPNTPLPYGSTAALFDEVSSFIAKYTGLASDDATLLTFVSFSSHFFDCVSMAACLLIFGPPIQAMSLLRVLACVCRHPILSSGSSVRGIPPELRATRFICQPDAGVDKELAALQFRGVNSFNGDPREISATTVVYAGDAEFKSPFADVCFSVPVLSDGPSFQLRDEDLETPTITQIQNKFLTYRLQNYSRIKASRFDVSEFSGFSREFARTLGAPIVDAPDLHARLIELLRPHDQADRTRNAVTLEAIILEALVVACHERNPSIHVGRIAVLANGILKERGEPVKISPKQAGGSLKKLGILTTRLDSGGRGIYLLGGQCARIHELGRAFGVASLRQGLPGCAYCQGQCS